MTCHMSSRDDELLFLRYGVSWTGRGFVDSTFEKNTVSDSTRNIFDIDYVSLIDELTTKTPLTHNIDFDTECSISSCYETRKLNRQYKIERDAAIEKMRAVSEELIRTKQLLDSLQYAVSYRCPEIVEHVKETTEQHVENTDTTCRFIVKLESKCLTAVQYDTVFSCKYIDRVGTLVARCVCGDDTSLPPHNCKSVLQIFKVGKFDPIMFKTNNTWRDIGYVEHIDNGKPTRANLKYSKRTRITIGEKQYDMCVKFQFPFVGGKGGHVSVNSTEFKVTLSISLPDSFYDEYKNGYLLIGRQQDEFFGEVFGSTAQDFIIKRKRGRPRKENEFTKKQKISF